MGLLNEELSVWEIAHRWAGYDPATVRVRLPLPVRDNCRILIDAIFNAEINSLTLRVEKWNPADGEEMRKFDIRYYLEEVHDCIDGKKFSRRMLRQASISRHEMKQWCNLHSIPLPEFWFPSGWGYAYDWKALDNDLEASVTQEATRGDAQAIRPSTAAKVACQQIALAIWKRSRA